VRGSLFYFRILHGMMQKANPADAMVFRKITTPIDAFVASLKQEPLDAIAVLGVLDPDLLNGLAALDVPIVVVDSAQPSSRQLDSVNHHGEESCFQAVSHLLQQGHRDIGILNFGDTPASRERYRAFERALASRGMQPDPEFCKVIECSSAAAYAAGRRLVKAARVPTAVFCTTDELAVGLISAAKDEGLKVPQQLSVVGYGDLGQFCMPALSTVRVPIEQMGVAAMQFLRERRAQRQSPAREFSVPTEFIARASSDVPRE